MILQKCILLLFICISHINLYAQNKYQFILKEALKGDGTYTYQLGHYYYYGWDGIEQDYTKAFRWYLKSGVMGSYETMAKMFLEGKGVNYDLGWAFYWWHKLAIAEIKSNITICSGMYSTGKCYRYGEGVKKDLQMAMYWFEKGYIKGKGHKYSLSDLCHKSIKELKKKGVTMPSDDYVEQKKKEAKEMWDVLQARNPLPPFPDEYGSTQNLASSNTKSTSTSKNIEVTQKTEKRQTPVQHQSENQTVAKSSKVISSSTVSNSNTHSDVDINIPTTNKSNDNTFAVIIANENYQMVEKVPYALNDGNTFESYCSKTLGIPSSNIHKISDATLNVMKYHIDWLCQVMKAYEGNANVIVFYAGHGIPDESTRSSFLLPVDGYASNISTGYSLENLYKQLESVPAKSVTIFLDACFSGSRRDGRMLSSTRGVAIKAKPTIPKGKIVVFSAAQGDETAYPYEEKKHGMFTYFLLKKLQQTKGEVSLGELASYISKEVRKSSIVKNGKMQNPLATPSVSITTSWQNYKLR